MIVRFSKSLSICCSLIVVSFVCVVYLFWFNFLYMDTNLIEIKTNVVNYKKVNYAFTKEHVFYGEKIVHLDLKGAAPKVSYYAKLFPLLSKLGATGILLEYEDMFPYNTTYIRNVSALNAYSLTDVKQINFLAEKSNLKIMLLFESVNNLDFLLKLEDYKEYREVPEYPHTICTTHEKIINLLTSMINQLIEMHPKAYAIHIGAHEVFHIGICNRCNAVMNKYNINKNNLFLRHITSIVNKINENHPNLKILIWDDEFRLMSLNDLENFDVKDKLIPVVWNYNIDVAEDIDSTVWETYKNTFKSIWIASSFKGATAPKTFVSDVTHYVQNHRSWLMLINEYKSNIHFEGIIITGRQRYDHFSVLCELLPVSIPTLAMSLRLLLGYNDSPLSPPTEIAKLLQCMQPYALFGSAFGTPKCSYPGGELLESLLHLYQLKQEFDNTLEDNRLKGWLSPYNIHHAFSNPYHVERLTSSLNRIMTDLNKLEKDIRKQLLNIYDLYTTDEWMEIYMQPLKKQVDDLWHAKQVILSKSTWPKRPFVK